MNHKSRWWAIKVNWYVILMREYIVWRRWWCWKIAAAVHWIVSTILNDIIVYTFYILGESYKNETCPVNESKLLWHCKRIDYLCLHLLKWSDAIVEYLFHHPLISLLVVLLFDWDHRQTSVRLFTGFYTV